MKYVAPLVVLALIGCSPMPPPVVKTVQVVAAPKQEGCYVDMSTKLVNQHVVGPITDLVEEKVEGGLNGQCTVRFNMVVNGKQYQLEDTYVGWEQTVALCYMARERARKNFLLDLGGEFKSEASMDCRHTDS